MLRQEDLMVYNQGFWLSIFKYRINKGFIVGLDVLSLRQL